MLLLYVICFICYMYEYIAHPSFLPKLWLLDSCQFEWKRNCCVSLLSQLLLGLVLYASLKLNWSVCAERTSGQNVHENSLEQHENSDRTRQHSIRSRSRSISYLYPKMSMSIACSGKQDKNSSHAHDDNGNVQGKRKRKGEREEKGDEKIEMDMDMGSDVTHIVWL